ncbi:hypothetical protein [Rhizobium sp. WYJ-E13]|uniref:hypothetical protein n=1 Tax=Rhizobium sp. WYJ-E13 TaxID=2849093 RepID=UPI0020A72932|nr:hypothetical protein [Rhizobium sp. WYJ-E13]
MRESLWALQEHENAVEHWLRTEVAAAYDAYKAYPTEAKSIDEAWKCLGARMDEIDRDDD